MEETTILADKSSGSQSLKLSLFLQSIKSKKAKEIDQEYLSGTITMKSNYTLPHKDALSGTILDKEIV
ncbi:11227_t:CDS:2 [Gigaspora margarita]|uniref:11227_t:CDS:1 n=1 Tax=Gigaspora margarita TaxID=4874 RepID=A0ABN7UV87_GIGMA|nr:11227_t:CDS:2 [Gigaspora margarita]